MLDSDFSKTTPQWLAVHYVQVHSVHGTGKNRIKNLNVKLYLLLKALYSFQLHTLTPLVVNNIFPSAALEFYLKTFQSLNF